MCRQRRGPDRGGPDNQGGLNRFRAGLSQESRIISLRRYWYLCSVKETAAACGLSESRVKMSLLRSRKALRQLLEKEEVTL